MTTSVLIVAVLVLLVLLIVAAVIRLREIGACLVLIDARVDSANRRLHRHPAPSQAPRPRGCCHGSAAVTTTHPQES